MEVDRYALGLYLALETVETLTLETMVCLPQYIHQYLKSIPTYQLYVRYTHMFDSPHSQ